MVPGYLYRNIFPVELWLGEGFDASAAGKMPSDSVFLLLAYKHLAARGDGQYANAFLVYRDAMAYVRIPPFEVSSFIEVGGPGRE